MQLGYHLGARNEASGFALRVDLQTHPQTTFEITPAIAFRISWQLTARLGRQIALHFGFGIDCQFPVGFAPQTGCGTGVEVAF
jgi:hypothetical protein